MMYLYLLIKKKPMGPQRVGHEQAEFLAAKQNLVYSVKSRKAWSTATRLKSFLGSCNCIYFSLNCCILLVSC